jgi:hypothetical protein
MSLELIVSRIRFTGTISIEKLLQKISMHYFEYNNGFLNKKKEV